MLIKNGKLTFEGKDWGTGLAKEVISYLKDNGCKYDSKLKLWMVTPKIESMLKNRYPSSFPIVKDKDDFDKVFGAKTDKDGLKYMITLIDEIKDYQSLANCITENNGDTELLGRVNKVIKIKKELLNSLIKKDSA